MAMFTAIVSYLNQKQTTLWKFCRGRRMKRLQVFFLSGCLLVGVTAARHAGAPASEPTAEATATIDSLVGLALTLQGVPYQYAGKDPRGFDCSGFTGYVFRHIGIDLNASSATQFGQGTSIAADSIQRGDLVFFSNKQGRINHVGIVVDPDCPEVSFIHASSSRGIRVDYLQSAYYAERFVGARRIIAE